MNELALSQAETPLLYVQDDWVRQMALHDKQRAENHLKQGIHSAQSEVSTRTNSTDLNWREHLDERDDMLRCSIIQLPGIQSCLFSLFGLMNSSYPSKVQQVHTPTLFHVKTVLYSNNQYFPCHRLAKAGETFKCS